MYFKEIDSDEWIYIGDTPLVTRLPGISSSARGYINFKITKDGYLDNTLLTTVGFIKGISLRKEMNFYEVFGNYFTVSLPKKNKSSANFKQKNLLLKTPFTNKRN